MSESRSLEEMAAAIESEYSGLKQRANDLRQHKDARASVSVRQHALAIQKLCDEIRRTSLLMGKELQAAPKPKAEKKLKAAKPAPVLAAVPEDRPLPVVAEVKAEVKVEVKQEEELPLEPPKLERSPAPEEQKPSEPDGDGAEVKQQMPHVGIDIVRPAHSAVVDLGAVRPRPRARK